MTDDEMTVLMIAAQGESMIPIGRWEKPIRDLTEQGLMRCNDASNYVITEKGCAAVRKEEAERDGAFAKALGERRGNGAQADTIKVAMTVYGRCIWFELTYDPNFVADVNTRTYLNLNGACEPEVVHLMRRVLREGDFAIDGGANIGFMTLIMSRLVGEQGRVEAFEPAVVNFKKLKSNLALNGADNVNVVGAALWSEDTDVSLYQSVDSGSSSLNHFEGALTNIKVGGMTLDRWCATYDPAPRFMKLDIEGSELHALMGADRMLTRGIDFITCELNEPAMARFGTTQLDLRDHMASKGYSTFLLMEDGSRPMYVERDQMIRVPRENFNILFSTEDKVHMAWAEVL